MQKQPEMNPYHTLKVSKDAHQDDIKKAYRAFAKILHPDNQDTGNEAEFLIIQKAYDVIGNPIRRKHYDDTGLLEMLPPVEERVPDALASLFNQKVIDVILDETRDDQDKSTGSFLSACVEQIHSDRHMLSITSQGIQQAIDHVVAMQHRLAFSGDDADNVLLKVCEQKIEQMTHQLNMNKDTDELFGAILTALENYSDSYNLLPA